MFNELFTYFKGSNSTFISAIQSIYNLVQHFEANYVAEGDRNAAIDAAITILQSYKTAVVTTPATTTPTVGT
jgi:hypothetical protein